MAKAAKTANQVEEGATPEVKDVKAAPETPIAEEPKKEEPIEEATIGAAKVEVAAPVKEVPKVEVVAAPTLRPELDHSKSHEERILAFLEGRKTGDFVKLNDFLKSLYPLPKPGMLPQFTDQPTMKKLKHLFSKMQSEGKVVFSTNYFERLGKHYYDGTDVEQKTKYHNITTVPIEAKIPQ